MRKDITFPKVENILLAAILEWNDDFMENIWNVYLINNSENTLDSIMVVSKAFGTLNGEMRKTSMLRHAFMEIPAFAAIKVEMIENSVLALNNEFMLTYFIGNTLYDKKFIFRANTINEHAMRDIPVLNKKGVAVL
ncbi:MAG: hypothetical protein RBR78_02580 [Flavobacteriaceae bacterium]|jgi:hypothetical protein|nr:hypothetical protein [Flavobacteriaceae bacterium]